MYIMNKQPLVFIQILQSNSVRNYEENLDYYCPVHQIKSFELLIPDGKIYHIWVSKDIIKGHYLESFISIAMSLLPMDVMCSTITENSDLATSENKFGLSCAKLKLFWPWLDPCLFWMTNMVWICQISLWIWFFTVIMSLWNIWYG